MLFRETASALAVVMLLALVGAAPALASAASRHAAAHRAHGGSTGAPFVGVRSAPGLARGRVGGLGRSAHYAALVGDPGGGYGFYPLPLRYRIGAWRERQRRAMEARYAFRFAIASQAVYDAAYWGGYGYGYGYGRHQGIFNPVDGYGTPFFPGYYGPAGDSDGERGLFGRPYDN